MKSKTKKMQIVVPIEHLPLLHISAAKKMKSVNQYIVETAIEAAKNEDKQYN